MTFPSSLWIPTLAFSSFLLIISPASTGRADAAGERVLSGEHEYGEKYTAVYVESEDAADARDDEEFDRYRYNNSWLQWDQVVREGARVSVRAQRLDRDYVTRPQLDNHTTHGQVRLTFEPAPGWALWPHVSVRQRDYDQRSLDNLIVTSGVEARYRWGIRHSVRIGASWSGSRYNDESFRDRDQAAVFASFERPVNERLTMRFSGRAEATDFDMPSPTRENSTRGSASVGFRLEL